jgi:hypothetical protein
MLTKEGQATDWRINARPFVQEPYLTEALIQYAHDMGMVTEHPAARVGGTRINHLIPCQDPESGFAADGFAADGPPTTIKTPATSSETTSARGISCHLIPADSAHMSSDRKWRGQWRKKMQRLRSRSWKQSRNEQPSKKRKQTRRLPEWPPRPTNMHAHPYLI